MKIYKAAIIGLGASGLAVNKLILNNTNEEIIAFENTNIENRDNFFGFWLTEWMKPFEELIDKKWNTWSISNDSIQVDHNDTEHPYCVISFKKWKKYCLDTVNNLEIKKDKVINYYPFKNYFKIVTESKKEYFAEKIYDSRHSKIRRRELLQHFYGISIVTKDKKFKSNKLTLMHFTEEKNILHFIYILPFSSNKALVESTVFSTEVYSDDWYKKKISKYLKDLDIDEFDEVGIEKGVIPMFFAEEKVSKDPNIFNIGIRGGACKPSTGYVFAFLIKQIQLLKNSNKNHVCVHNNVEKIMDKIFLNYLKNNNENGKSFINLAKNLNGVEFQSFMMGQSSILTKLKVVLSMPKLKFIKAIFK